MSETLFRLVNGVRVEVSEEEAAAIRAEWALPPPPPRRVVTSLAFLERFTQAERITIRQAARQSADLEDWLDMLRAAQEIDLDDPRTNAGLLALSFAGLLTAERRAEILS